MYHDPRLKILGSLFDAGDGQKRIGVFSGMGGSRSLQIAKFEVDRKYLLEPQHITIASRHLTIPSLISIFQLYPFPYKSNHYSKPKYIQQQKNIDNVPGSIPYHALNNHQCLTQSWGMFESDQVQIKKPSRQGSSIVKQ